MENKTVNFVKVKEASAYFGVTKATVCNWYNKGLLSGRKINNLILLDKECVYKKNNPQNQAK